MLSFLQNNKTIKISPLDEMINQYHFLSKQINALELQLNEVNIGDSDILYYNIESHKKARTNLYQQIKLLKMN